MLKNHIYHISIVGELATPITGNRRTLELFPATADQRPENDFASYPDSKSLILNIVSHEMLPQNVDL
jgi:hypothetical protein